MTLHLETPPVRARVGVLGPETPYEAAVKAGRRTKAIEEAVMARVETTRKLRSEVAA